jgi:Ca2+-binding RTX toxin-like protein
MPIGLKSTGRQIKFLGVTAMATIFGSSQAETLRGTSSRDLIFGLGGNDVLNGNSDRDLLSGGSGNDTLSGGLGSDVLKGDDGDDILLANGDSQLLGLADQNRLVAFDPSHPKQTTKIQVTGVDGNLIGIDFRPANGLLYGITDTNKIYTIDIKTGIATLVSPLSPIGFNAGQQSGVDFNPVPDRLRLVGSNDQNLRVNVDTGAIADFDLTTPAFEPDKNVSYPMGDRNFGQDPNVTAVAYTNAFAGAPSTSRTTQLFGIDSKLDTLVLQNPPNDGKLTTIGSLGVDFGTKGGFDIFSPVNGVNFAYAASGSTLYSIDVSTGAAKSLGQIGNGEFKLLGLAATTVSGAEGNDILQGGNGNDLLVGGLGDDLLSGGNGNDTLRGNDGQDTLKGDDGQDVLNGGNGNDFLRGGNGNDRMIGGLGNDNLDGGNLHDSLRGGADIDSLSGSSGNDSLDGGSSNDFLWGGSGNDLLIGGLGSDKLNGGDGNDLLLGGSSTTLFGLTDRNALIAFDPDQIDQAQTIQVTGVDGNLLGIDFRPANGLLYGITDTNKIYTINASTGVASLVSALSPINFNAGQQSGVDFNPVPDRLRLVGSNDQNLRVNVDTGAIGDFDLTTPAIEPDKNVSYSMGDRNFGQDPNITAVAYTNAFFGPPSPTGVIPPTRTTQLFGIDANLDVLVLQNPPNDGKLTTIGALGVNFGASSGFDIFSPINGVNFAYATSGSTLYSIDLSTGAATSLGEIGKGGFNLIGLAAPTAPSADSGNTLRGGDGNDTLTGGSGDDLLIGGGGNDLLIAGGGLDKIVGFASGLDKIVLNKAIFSSLTSAVGQGFSTAGEFAIVENDLQAATSSAQIVFNRGSGSLFYNQNSSQAGLGTGSQFATVDTPSLQATDFQIA